MSFGLKTRQESGVTVVGAKGDPERYPSSGLLTSASVSPQVPNLTIVVLNTPTGMSMVRYCYRWSGPDPSRRGPYLSQTRYDVREWRDLRLH